MGGLLFLFVRCRLFHTKISKKSFFEADFAVWGQISPLVLIFLRKGLESRGTKFFIQRKRRGGGLVRRFALRTAKYGER